MFHKTLWTLVWIVAQLWFQLSGLDCGASVVSAALRILRTDSLRLFLILFYNLLYTGLPPAVLGLLDHDIASGSLERSRRSPEACIHGEPLISNGGNVEENW
jgi:hypothetical protein